MANTYTKIRDLNFYSLSSLRTVRILGDSIIGEPVLTKYETETFLNTNSETVTLVKIAVRGKYFHDGYIFLRYDEDKEQLTSVFQSSSLVNPDKTWIVTYKKVK